MIADIISSLKEMNSQKAGKMRPELRVMDVRVKSCETNNFEFRFEIQRKIEPNLERHLSF